MRSGVEVTLFPDLPEQSPPATLYTDRHTLEMCSRCGGTGRVECWYPKWYDVALFWDPTCRACEGAGRIIRCVGDVRDA